jgi:type II secretory pathway pseudopilin PulG
MADHLKAKPSRRPDPRGFTLPELFLSISVTALIGLAVASVSVGLSNAYHSTDEMEDAVQTGRAAMNHMEELFRGSKLVLAQSHNQVAVWTGDADASGSVNLDEIVLVAGDSADGVVTARSVDLSEAEAGVREALNEVLALEEVDTVGKVRGRMDGGGVANYKQELVLADEVSGFNVETDQGAPYTGCLSLRMTVGQGGEQITLNTSVALRADAREYVGEVGGRPHLDMPDQGGGQGGGGGGP